MDAIVKDYLDGRSLIYIRGKYGVAFNDVINSVHDYYNKRIKICGC